MDRWMGGRVDGWVDDAAAAETGTAHSLDLLVITCSAPQIGDRIDLFER